MAHEENAMVHALLNTHTQIAQDMQTQHALLDTYAVCLYVRMHVHGMHT